MSAPEKLVEAVLAQVCWVTGCRNRKKLKSTNGVMIMFPFPRDEKLSDFWLAICNRIPYSCPFHGQLVCIDHFDKDDLTHCAQEGTSTVYLLPDAVPKLNVPNIVQPILEEYWIQKKLGVTPVLRSIKVEYAHKSFALKGDICHGVDPDLIEDTDDSLGGVKVVQVKPQLCMKK